MQHPADGGGDFGTAAASAAAVRRREISPLELLEATLARVARLDPAINAIVWCDADAARRDARRASEEVMHRPPDELAPFHGVPIPIKDLTPVAGWPTTYGSWAASPEPATESALVVHALRRAGFVLVGRTNTSEFGALPVAENLRYGSTRNPWDLHLTAGGSSGGAAAAVSAGMFSIAHGNDGGGSIRVPASCTGVVGMKASRGRVPSRYRHWDGTSVEGVLTHDVHDAALALDQISGPDRRAWFNAPPPVRPFADEVGRAPGRLRIGIQTAAPMGLPVHPECAAAARATADALADAGHQVVAVELELLTEAAITGFVLMAAVARSAIGQIEWDRAEPNVRSSRDWALWTTSVGYAETLQRVEAYSRRLTADWGEHFDVLLTPTMATLPPPAGAILEQSHAHVRNAPLALLQMTAFTTAANLAGLPSISLPVPQAASGIPIGVMLTAGPWDDGPLLRLAGQVEQLQPWSARTPPRG